MAANLHINLTPGHPTAEESLVLDIWAGQTMEESWRLDHQKALAAIENGHDVDALIEFLQAREDQPLPETVESFVKTCRTNGKALKVAGAALLIECRSTDIAETIAIRLEHEEKFRTSVRILGCGMTT
jgi:hypothetical protein